MFLQQLGWLAANSITDIVWFSHVPQTVIFLWIALSCYSLLVGFVSLMHDKIGYWWLNLGSDSYVDSILWAGEAHIHKTLMLLKQQTSLQRTYMNIHVSIRIKQVVPCPLSISVFYSKLLAILVALSAKKLPLECAKKNTRPVTKCLYEGIWFCSSTPKSSNSHICQIKAADWNHRAYTYFYYFCCKALAIKIKKTLAKQEIQTFQRQTRFGLPMDNKTLENPKCRLFLFLKVLRLVSNTVQQETPLQKGQGPDNILLLAIR